ncbi:MAG: hypothetical protein F4218_01240 [Synechococcus sp. SB0677_bin_5]|nr:hypothetical protein [Synechococcus sp. SB0677_bin_5]
MVRRSATGRRPHERHLTPPRAGNNPIRTIRLLFARIKEDRGSATRYDKTDTSFAANWHLVAALLASH